MISKHEQSLDPNPTQMEYMSIPRQPLQTYEAAEHPDRKLVVMIPGAFHTGETFDLLQTQVEMQGHDTLAVTLETDNPKLTSADDAAQVADAIGDRRGIIALTWSRGVEPLVRLPRLLQPGQLEGAIVMGSGGPHEFLLPLEIETQSTNPRYNPGHRDAMIELDNGLTMYDPDAARYYFYHDVDPAITEIAIKQLVPQRKYVPDGKLESWDPDLPTLILLGRSDRILDAARARSVARRFFHANAEMMTGGHSLHLSQPEALGRRILQFITDELPAVSQ